MRKNVYRILSGFLAVLMLFVATLPAHAISTGSPLYDTIDFYTYVYGIYKGWKDGNPNSDDSLYPGFRPGGSFGSGPTGGGSFSKDEAKAAYDDYVETLPALAYSSGNELRWRLNISSYAESSSASVISFIGGSSFEVQYLAPSWGSSYPILSIGVDEFKAPVSGDYRLGCWFSGPSSFYGKSSLA